MNIIFSCKASDTSFSEALINSKNMQQWMLNRMMGYTTHSEKITLEICIDHFTKGDIASYNWAVYSQSMDDYGWVVPNTMKNPIINGGLIYRGTDENGDVLYSSHT